jgi:ribosomal-protein-alanine N-acetyltransferase
VNSKPVSSLSTDRLTLRLPAEADADFFVRLLNDADWLRFIGDRGVRNPADARSYIEEKLLASFRQHGFGLWVVESRADGKALGICGLLKRDTLDDIDVGFAFLPEARGVGYGTEAARRVLEFAAADLGLSRIVAITVPANAPSARLLERLGLSCERTMVGEAGDELLLFAIDLSAS